MAHGNTPPLGPDLRHRSAVRSAACYGALQEPPVSLRLPASTVERLGGDIAKTADHLHLPLGLVQAAVAYYGAFVDEIDEWITRNEHEATHADNAWLAGQAALQR